MESKWTDEQQKLIDTMIKEAEAIGYTDGWNTAIREIIELLLEYSKRNN